MFCLGLQQTDIILLMSDMKRSVQGRQPLLSQQKSFPQVFRWKVAAIIISVLIAIFLVVDIILLVHYNNSQPRKNNFTFMADLLDYSAGKGDIYSTQKFINAATALSKSYSQIWFQSATLVSSWVQGSQLTLDQIGGFFDGDSDHQLFLLTINDGNNDFLGVAYSHIGFPLPNGDWQTYLSDPTKEYYTFQIADRQSTIVGGGSNSQFLRMSGSTANLRNCRVIRLNSSTFTFLEILPLDFSTIDIKLSPNVTASNSLCFDGEPTDPSAVQSQLQAILGLGGSAASLAVTKVQAFHLSL